jgi:hypothetical protein
MVYTHVQESKWGVLNDECCCRLLDSEGWRNMLAAYFISGWFIGAITTHLFIYETNTDEINHATERLEELCAHKKSTSIAARHGQCLPGPSLP